MQKQIGAYLIDKLLRPTNSWLEALNSQPLPPRYRHPKSPTVGTEKMCDDVSIWCLTSPFLSLGLLFSEKNIIGLPNVKLGNTMFVSLYFLHQQQSCYALLFNKITSTRYGKKLKSTNTKSTCYT
ncbi:MAG TPA: hypothetical protein VD884_06985, partial [Ohtaekwangia sp.]|nr:hypothetical protein [Ohtaekwangia sp.]